MSARLALFFGFMFMRPIVFILQWLVGFFVVLDSIFLKWKHYFSAVTKLTRNLKAHFEHLFYFPLWTILGNRLHRFPQWAFSGEALLVTISLRLIKWFSNQHLVLWFTVPYFSRFHFRPLQLISCFVRLFTRPYFKIFTLLDDTLCSDR